MSTESQSATRVEPIGLSEADADARLARFGPNEIAAAKGRSVLRIMLETMREPMFLLLAGASGLYLFLGDVGEGLFMVGVAAAAVALVVAQEARSERALSALRDLAQPQARVLRDGMERRIGARGLVPDDILLVGEGERMPADGALVAGGVLSVDESVLTGESAPVAKQPSSSALPAAEEPLPGGEAGSQLFAGTLVVRGQGVVRVTRTGVRSAVGQIGHALATVGHELTPLQKKTSRLAGVLGFAALGFCGLVAVAYGLLRGDWIEGVLAGITVAISLIPEEFPMVLAVFMALGAWRLARHQVLVRRSAVIETLGAATVLCVDKTGTLTTNRMQVARFWTREGDVAAAEGGSAKAAASALLRLAILASAVRPIDPMDRALRSLAEAKLIPDGLEEEEPRRAWPLKPELLAAIQLWKEEAGGEVAAAKGAPEAIFKLCRLSEAEVSRLHGVIGDWAKQGLRVLGVASARGEDGFIGEPQDAPFEFAGLVGFVDPLRADAPTALEQARAAGIKVVMITGDHPATALAVAKAAGLETGAGVLTGAEVAALSIERLRDRLQRVRVFARITPEQKLRIVLALKQAGEIVAMTGDGVNDAPALEAAHIGISMGRKGTDVAREASDLVLLDDSFASIVGGVRLGRRIFANLRRALAYVIAVHVPVAGLALAPILLGLPPLLLPMHVVLLELVIDPTCALVFEAEPSEEGAMERPPRPPGEALFGLRHVGVSMIRGATLMMAVLALYLWASATWPDGERAARGAGFLALVTGLLMLTLADLPYANRLFAPHRRAFWAIASAVAAVLVLVFTVPPVASVFKVAPPDPHLLLVAVVAGAAGGGWSTLAALARRFWSGLPTSASRGAV